MCPCKGAGEKKLCCRLLRKVGRAAVTGERECSALLEEAGAGKVTAAAEVFIAPKLRNWGRRRKKKSSENKQSVSFHVVLFAAVDTFQRMYCTSRTETVASSQQLIDSVFKSQQGRELVVSHFPFPKENLSRATCLCC